MAEARAVGSPHFFCPLSDVVPSQDLPRQQTLSVVEFDPVNRLDRS